MKKRMVGLLLMGVLAMSGFQHMKLIDTYFVEAADTEEMPDKTTESLHQYLDMMGTDSHSSDSFSVDQEFLDNVNNVYVMGRTGTVEHAFTDVSQTQIRIMTWVDNETATREEFDDFIFRLGDYYKTNPGKRSYENISDECYVWMNAGYSSYAVAWYEDNLIHINWYYDESLATSVNETEPISAESKKADEPQEETMREEDKNDEDVSNSIIGIWMESFALHSKEDANLEGKYQYAEFKEDGTFSMNVDETINENMIVIGNWSLLDDEKAQEIKKELGDFDLIYKISYDDTVGFVLIQDTEDLYAEDNLMIIPTLDYIIIASRVDEENYDSHDEQSERIKFQFKSALEWDYKNETEDIENGERRSEPTLGEQNALKKAENYLNLSAMSKSGLKNQLEYVGFTSDEASYAVEHCGADWNEQAARKAQSYLNLTAMSKKALIEQLEYVGFTSEQAQYGAKAVGY